jgi:tetratricopeptide (TPR) repeat protein
MKKIQWSILWTSVCLAGLSLAQGRDLSAYPDDFVLEKLKERIQKPNSQAELLGAVRQAISQFRQSADPRTLGQAQAMIGKLWSNPEASHELLTLQATIEQSRHEFANARKTLDLALSQPTRSQAQAWLTRATIERVQGEYAGAEKSCKSITDPSAQLYARACLLETISLQGQWENARLGYVQLLREQRTSEQQAWLYSLLAENEQRAGQLPQALKYFAISLSLDSDVYTALAYADALLSQKQAAQALVALQHQPDSDSVLIRRASAYKQLQDPRFDAAAQALEARMAALAQRRDSAGHAREQALFALDVQGKPQAAFALAQSNLQQQREPIDWRIAIQSAQQAGLAADKAKLIQAAAQTGLKDTSLR